MGVSIHAPAKEATFGVFGTYGYINVSIHAPAKEATTGRSFRRFTKGVSIHAPAKEATSRLPRLIRLILSFNPRPREGGD